MTEVVGSFSFIFFTFNIAEVKKIKEKKEEEEEKKK